MKHGLFPLILADWAGIAFFARFMQSVQGLASVDCLAQEYLINSLRLQHSVLLSRVKLESEIMLSPPAPDEVGPYYFWGEIGRMQRRYHEQEDQRVFDLNYKLLGESRIPVLIELLNMERTIEKLLLAYNAVTDEGLSLLSKCLNHPDSNVTSLDVSNNKLTEKSVGVLLPLLQVVKWHPYEHIQRNEES